MRILVTGAAGFIGSNLSKRFLEEGHEVIGIDNFITGSKSNIDELKRNPRFYFEEYDVIKPVTFIEGKLDWIMHLASPASPPKYMENSIETLRVNSEGTMNLLLLCKEKGAKFFFSSTSEIYGDTTICPQPESYFGNVNSYGERSCYDEAKRYAEAMIFSMHKKYKIPVRVVRIFNTYGPGMDLYDGRVITSFIQKILDEQPLTIFGDGQQTRSFMYIDDLIEGIIRLMKVDYNQPVNLGNEEEHKIIELIDMLQNISGKKFTVKYMTLPQDDPKRRNPEITVAKKILNWTPNINLEQGLKLTYNYFIEKRWEEIRERDI